LEIWKSRIDHSFTDLAGRKSTKTASFSRFPVVSPGKTQDLPLEDALNRFLASGDMTGKHILHMTQSECITAGAGGPQMRYTTLTVIYG